MKFAMARSDVVRAINQRWLLKFWKQNLGDHRVPLWQSITAGSLNSMSGNLGFFDVISSGVETRYLIRFNGGTVSAVYGSTDGRAKFLDELVPPERHATHLAPYHQAVDGRCPVYTIHDLNDHNGRLVHHELLLLPFGADGERVDRILASFEFICPDGAFEERGLMHAQQTPPAQQLAARIDVASLM